MPLLGTRGAASAKGFGLTASVGAPPGQQAYTTDGTYSWVCPAGVTSVSVVAVAAGAPTEQNSNRRGQGLGGCLSYKNNITVVPGTSYTVYITQGSWASITPESYFKNTSTVQALGQSTRVGDGGGNGGNGGPAIDGGGGAGGYSGNGGNGGATAGSGGGGGGGAIYLWNASSIINGAGGGGVGLLGQGSNGAAGTGSSNSATGGGGGSGGSSGGSVSGNNYAYGNGGNYGGGAGDYYDGNTGVRKFADPAGGAVRIIWPGTTRSFPSTNTGNL